MATQKFNMNLDNTFLASILTVLEPVVLFASKMGPSTKVSFRKMPSMEKAP